jgi:amino acid permease
MLTIPPPSYCSIVAAVALLYTAFLVCFRSKDYINDASLDKVKLFNMDWGFSNAFGNLLFCFNCHLNVVPVASELENPEKRRIKKIAVRV